PRERADATKPRPRGDLQRRRGSGCDHRAGDAAHRRGSDVRLVDPGDAQCVARPPAGSRSTRRMNVLIYLVPAALALGLTGLVVFLWSLRSGQYEDLDGAAIRVLGDDDISP